MRNRLRFIPFIWIFIVSSLPSFGQSALLSQLGSPPINPTLPIPQGYVNLTNGNVHLEFPIQSVKQRGGADLTVKLVYDSFFYDETFDGEVGVWGPSEGSLPSGAGAGWSYIVAPAANVMQVSHTVATCAPDGSPGPSGPEDTWTNWVYVDANNTAHPFGSVVTTERPNQTTNCGNVPTAAGPASDGSGYYISISNYDLPTVYDVNGNIVYTYCTTSINPNPSLDPSNSANCWIDRNGNKIATWDVVPVEGVIDTSGRDVTLPSGFAVNTSKIQVGTTFSSDESLEADYDGTIQVVSSITLPGGREYSFSYDQGGSGHSGVMTSMTLPTGGVVSFTSQMQKSQGLEYGPVPIQSVVTPDGTWGFTINQNSLTTVTAPPDPTSHVSSQMTYNLQTQTLSQYAGQATGTPLRSVATTYGQSSEASMYGQTFQPATVTTTLENGESYKVVYTYQGIPYPTNPNATYAANLIKTKQEYDASGALIRETDVAYQTAAQYLSEHINGLPLSMTVYGAGGATSTALAKTTYGYDGTALSTTSGSKTNSVLGTATHDDADYGATHTIRGNLTSITQMASASASIQTLTNYYNILGDLVESTDGRGNSTNYDYTDSWVNNTSCVPSSSFALPTSVTNALGQHSANTYNACDGSVHSVLDQNDLNASRAGTVYSYDGLQRLTGTSYPDGGSQTTNYGGSSVPEVITVTTTATPDPSVVTSTTLDGLGRTITSEVNSDPAGADLTSTTYDSLGRLYTVTNPYREGQSGILALSQGTTTYAHDALGRVITQTNPDGSTQIWCYNGVSSGQGGCAANASSMTGKAWVDHYDETGRHWQHISDVLGRLVAVMEPNNSTGAVTLETDYGYDALSNLTRVDQWGGPVNSVSDRLRTFTYDSLSRLVCASNPENSSAQCPTQASTSYTAGTVGYSYDGNGNVTSKTDARGVPVNYTYDALNRMLSKSSPGATNIPGFNYTYGYDTVSGVSATNLIGRLAFIYTGTGGTSTIYSYDSRGRIDTQWTYLPSAPSTPDVVSAQYDLAGNLTHLTYPDGRAINEQWNSAGEVSQITDATGYEYLTPSSTYAANGMVQTMWHANGAVDSNLYNSRQHSIQKGTSLVGTGSSTGLTPTYLGLEYCYGPPTSALSSTYKGCPSIGSSKDNGNILSIIDVFNPSDTQNFTYDSLNRLITFSNAGNTLSQNYTLDAFGNMSQQGTATFQANFGTNNRISDSGVGYDNAGDVTQFNNGVVNNAYVYDAESKLLNVNNGFAGYTYDAGGNRVRKDYDGGYTEYISFNGQPIAEKSYATCTSGSGCQWSDYIFANGERIARSDSFDINLQVSGTNCSNCGSPNLMAGTSVLSGAISGHVIGSGDLLTWRQYESASALGGIYLGFSDGTNGNAAEDKDGQPMDADTTSGSWHVRVVDLSPFAGKTITTLGLYQSANAPQGVSWSIAYGDITLVSSNGSFFSIYHREQAGGALATTAVTPSAIAGLTAVTPKTTANITPTATATFYHGDQISSTRVLTAGTGFPVESDTYYPYGEQSTGNAALAYPGNANHFHFTGKERDTESGNDYFGARYYGSSMGRFLSPDYSDMTFGPDAVPNADYTNPQSLNLYAYGQNNPVKNIDPDGHDCIDTSNFSKDGTVAITTGDSCANNLGPNGTYVNGTINQNSITANVSASGTTFGYDFTSYDGQSGGAGVIAQAPAYGPLEGPANLAGAAMIGSGTKAIGAFAAGSVVGGVLGAGGLAVAGSELTLSSVSAAVRFREAQAAWLALKGTGAAALIGQFFKTGEIPPGLTPQIMQTYLTMAQAYVQSGIMPPGGVATQMQRITQLENALGK